MTPERPRSPELLEPATIADDLGRQSVRGGFLVVVGRAGGNFIRLASLAILARLIAPEDFGLVAIATTFLGIACVFRGLGLTSAIVQQKDLEDADVAALFWINALATVILGAAVAGLVPWLADIYELPALRSILPVLIISFMLYGFCQPHYALLVRRMQFGHLAAVDIIGPSAGSILAIGLGFLDYAYWALVLGFVLTDVVSTALVVTLNGRIGVSAAWRKSVRHLTVFGLRVTVFNLFYYLSQNVHSLFLGLHTNVANVGFYSRAHALVTLPLGYISGPLSVVCVPVLTRLSEQPQRYERFYAKAMSILFMLAAPIGVFCFLYTEVLVRVILGPGWEQTADIFRFLALSIVVQPLITSVNWVFVTTGRSEALMGWGGFVWTFHIILLGFAAQYGGKALAIAHSTGLVLIALPSLAWAFRGTSLSYTALFKAVLPALVAAGCAGVLTLFVDDWVLGLSTGPVYTLLIAGLIFGAWYILLLSEVLKQRSQLSELISLLLKRSSFQESS